VPDNTERFVVVKDGIYPRWLVVDTAPDRGIAHQVGDFYDDEHEAITRSLYLEAFAAEEAGFTSVAAKYYEAYEDSKS
jgi:hypothetical protein